MELIIAVQNYLSDGRKHLSEMKKYYKALSIELAVQYAAIGKTPSGSMDSHQRRVGEKQGYKGGQELLKHLDEIRNCKSFEDIFKITEKVKSMIYRLGDLWSYDAALRIGFNLSLYPSQVYVQRGVIMGVKKVLNRKRPKGRSLPLTCFPEEVQQLKPYEAENFLCIFGKDGGKSYC